MLDQFKVEYKESLTLDITKITDLKIRDKCQVLREGWYDEETECIEECLHHVKVTYEDNSSEEAIVSSDLFKRILVHLNQPYPYHLIPEYDGDMGLGLFD